MKVCGLGSFDGKRRRSAHCNEGAKSTRPSFLDNLETRSAADIEAKIRRRCAVEHHLSDDLVDGVVASNVFANLENFSIAVERCSSVHGTCFVEELLFSADHFGHFCEKSWLERLNCQRCKAVGEPVDCIRSAQAA